MTEDRNDYYDPPDPPEEELEEPDEDAAYDRWKDDQITDRYEREGMAKPR